MQLKQRIVYILLGLLCICSISYAQVGQYIQINTRFRSFVGQPSWTLIIRDLDHQQNLPQVFNITRGSQHWTLFTYSNNYLISASRLQVVNYRGKYNMFNQYIIHNFCGLESNGRIIRGKSMMIQISGDLSPNSNSYSCSVMKYRNEV